MAAGEAEFELKIIAFTQRRVDALKEILKGRGMDEDRVWLRCIAASEVEIGKRGQE